MVGIYERGCFMKEGRERRETFNRAIYTQRTGVFYGERCSEEVNVLRRRMYYGKRGGGGRVSFFFFSRRRCIQWRFCSMDGGVLLRVAFYQSLDLGVQKAVVAFSSRARILGECSTIHSPPVLFFFLSGD